jgi:hypothetical protein
MLIFTGFFSGWRLMFLCRQHRADLGRIETAVKPSLPNDRYFSEVGDCARCLPA